MTRFQRAASDVFLPLDASVDSGPCLSDEEVVAFSEGALMPSEIDSVHAHLDWCPICQELVNAAVHQWDHPPETLLGGRHWAGNFSQDQIIGGRYTIERFLGHGGMGEVYSAFDQVLLERVAIKTVLSTTSDSPHARRRLFSEARLARRISHPNVCRVHDVGVHQGPGPEPEELHFLTMQFIDGRRLGQILRDGPLHLPLVYEVAKQMLLGLCAAHEAGVLHGDLKSDNVMLTGYPREPRVAITDFGLARALDPASRAAGTGGKGRAGSAAYMAPEQILGQDLGPETDLFCFGVVLFEMLCGSRPFRLDASGCRPVLGGGRAEAAPPPSALRPGVSGQLDALVLGCLNADSSARYQNAAHVLRVLELVFAGGGFDRVTPMDTPELHPLDLQSCC